MLGNSSNNKGFLIILFIIWPFSAFLIAVNQFHKREYRIIIYCFLILFGLTFVLGNDKLDSFRYAEYFQNIAELSISELKVVFTNLYDSEKTLDLAKPGISFIVSRITTDYRAFFGIIAAIFGFFYLKSIGVVFENQYEINKNKLSLFFLLYLALIINPIFNINGFRFYTAAWIFFYGVYSYLTSKEKRHLLIVMLSVFFHFSFFAPVGIFVMYLIIGNRNRFYFLLLIASFFLSEIAFHFIPQVADFLGEGVLAKTQRYANTNTMESRAEYVEWAQNENKWYIYLPGQMTFYYIAFAFLFLLRKVKRVQMEVPLQNLVSFSLLFLAFANTVSFIPSMARFRTVFLMFGLTVILGILKYFYSKKMTWLLLVGVIPFLLNLTTVIRLGLDITNPWIFGFSPLPFWFSDLSIYQLLF